VVLNAGCLVEVGHARRLRHRIPERGQNPIAQTAHPAIGGDLASQAAFILGGQELNPDTGVHVGPGQHFIRGTLPTGVPTEHKQQATLCRRRCKGLTFAPGWAILGVR
jgi:hypothetical protein